MVTTRRAFLKGLAFAPLGVACAGVPVVDGGDRARDRVVLSLGGDGDAEARIGAVLDELDTSWLGQGDSVLLKVACNSGNPHPAVTSPTAVRAMCRVLLDRGAGRVLVGDQSGTMSVRLAEGDRRFGSTRELMERNGLLAAIEEGGGEPRFFDDDGFDDGYVEVTLPEGAKAWPTAPFVARAITEVDHVVYLPRLASHVLTGYTHGHKIAVGWLRDDSRHLMHAAAGDIYEKYTEINYCEELRSRLRLVLTFCEEVLVDGGPDGGGVATLDAPLVLASARLSNHDAASVPILAWAQRTLPRARNTGGVPYGPWAPLGNLALLQIVEETTKIPWRSTHAGPPHPYLPHDYAASIAADRALVRAYELEGGVPRTIDVAVLGDAPPSLVARLGAQTPLALIRTA
jgi:uncharacterized protein (DUF362 family)